MTRRPALILTLLFLLLIVGAFTAEALLRQTTCISAMIQDANSVTVYPTVCS